MLMSVYYKLIVQELCESRGGRPGLSVLTSLLVSVDVIGHSLSLIYQPTSEDFKHHFTIIITISLACLMLMCSVYCLPIFT